MRVTPEEAAWVRRQAEKSDAASLTEWMRQRILEGLKR